MLERCVVTSYAARTSIALFCAVLIGVGVYVLVTFAITYAHVPKRGLFHTFGYAFRESVLAVFVTMLFPLYVAVGHKRGAGTKPVILVHGYTQNRADFVYLSRFLRARGLGPVYGFNYFRSPTSARAASASRSSSSTSARTPARARSISSATRWAASSRATPFASRPSHSPLRHNRLASLRRRLPQNPIVGRGGRQLRAGTRFLMDFSGAPLGVPMLSIFSTHDNIVAPAHSAASLVPWGGRDFVVDHVGHLPILFDKRVATAVSDFLIAPEP